MAENHIDCNDSGEKVEFDEKEWISATKTRNYMIGDPILDWLNEYGEEKGFEKDTESEKYDKNLDFVQMIFKKGHEFENVVIEFLKNKFGKENFVTVATERTDSKDVSKARKTFETMQQGIPFILQGVLFNPNDKTYGMPDILVRSDFLNKIVDEEDTQISQESEDLGQDFHYRVIDVKFSSMSFNSEGEYLLDWSSQRAYKAQVAIYNRALGRLQGYEPPRGYILGRGWSRKKLGRERKCTNAFDRFGRIDFDNIDRYYYDKVDQAITWIRDLRKEGAHWELYPEPTTKELWPNSGNQSDYPWHNAKSEIVEKLKDVTKLWGVGLKEREKAHENNIFTWNDDNLTPAKIGIYGEFRKKVIEQIININKLETHKVLPVRINDNRKNWKEKPKLEFFVDFETVNNINDNFAKFPEQGGDALIFMIGCGHEYNGKFEFKIFTGDRLDVYEEARLITEWINYMGQVTSDILGETDEKPKIFHWSPAEVSFMKSARENLIKDGEKSELQEKLLENWPDLNWFDFIEVMREEPIVVKGAFGFGLKAIAKNLYRHGLIGTVWGDGPTDGLGAMVGAWYCDHGAEKKGISMREMDYMGEIEDYNEVDCKVMWALINYLRENHS